ncbi:hypothetical protein F1645_08925 [Novacetimonas hansenii]|uniref:Lipoprotein n=2 Tax=Novacetimonas hansenii TaxID=436 RepID=A0ABQ0SF75_NOVHA|nr:hypothetical protein [Novacetimonas hansenii]EFG82982.1 hypothetical protein GXY_15544 [Novacetimonas hansenii ATCC 23769]GAN82633.1 hypothetical protein Gaha_0029_012 [Novacetimonas hansenii JCM 7643]GBQ58082.1 hypothetical protein AA0243_1671 [Novacetimonas hansenii NRIC 0243]GEC63941.1 hypothetical protein GHA01_17900 [Novacetimonas hansenii]
MKKLALLTTIIALGACAHDPHQTPPDSVTARQGIEPQPVHTAQFGAMSRTASYAAHHANQVAASTDEKK